MRYLTIISVFILSLCVIPAAQALQAPVAPNEIEINNLENTRVIIQTKFGDIELKLYPRVAPVHVQNFVTLAKSGFYDGTIFHRVIPNFMIQGGDPKSKSANKAGHGTGGPGYSIKAEFSDRPHSRGILSMARSGHPDSAGSQFFIVVKDSNFLDGQYTVFGQVTSGMDVVDKIVIQQKDRRDNPLERTEISVRVIEPAPPEVPAIEGESTSPDKG